MDDDKLVANVERRSCLASVRIDGEDGGDLALVWEAQDRELPVVANFGRLKVGRALDLVVEVPRAFEDAYIERRLDRAVLRCEGGGKLLALRRLPGLRSFIFRVAESDLEERTRRPRGRDRR